MNLSIVPENQYILLNKKLLTAQRPLVQPQPPRGELEEAPSRGVGLLGGIQVDLISISIICYIQRTFEIFEQSYL